MARSALGTRPTQSRGTEKHLTAEMGSLPSRPGPEQGEACRSPSHVSKLEGAAGWACSARPAGKCSPRCICTPASWVVAPGEVCGAAGAQAVSPGAARGRGCPRARGSGRPLGLRGLADCCRALQWAWGGSPSSGPCPARVPAAAPCNPVGPAPGSFGGVERPSRRRDILGGELSGRLRGGRGGWRLGGRSPKSDANPAFRRLRDLSPRGLPGIPEFLTPFESRRLGHARSRREALREKPLAPGCNFCFRKGLWRQMRRVSLESTWWKVWVSVERAAQLRVWGGLKVGQSPKPTRLLDALQQRLLGA